MLGKGSNFFVLEESKACKRLSQRKMMKRYGLQNGVLKLFFFMTQSTSEVYVSVCVMVNPNNLFQVESVEIEAGS